MTERTQKGRLKSRGIREVYLDAIRTRWQRWLNRRIPPATSISLSHRSIFILPSKAGGIFLLLLIVMLITAINYQNNLIYALVFWLFSMSMGSTLLAFKNIAGLTLSALPVNAGFVGDELQLTLRVDNAKSNWSAGLQLYYPGNEARTVSLSPGQSQVIQLPYLAQTRGVFPNQRLRIESRFPFGLFTVWSWVALEYSIIVYPKVIESPLILSHKSDDDTSENDNSFAHTTVVDDEFFGFRNYRPGDSLKRIAWKPSARTDRLQVQEEEPMQPITCWLRWESLAGIDKEQRLSQLTAWVLILNQRGWRFGLSLPNSRVEIGDGDEHRRRCLEALALCP